MGVFPAPGGGGGPPPVPVPEAYTRYCASNGSDATGNGSQDAPYATAQKCYDALFPTGAPVSWADFDLCRKIVILPDTNAGALTAAYCKLCVESDQANLGIVTFNVDVNLPTTLVWAGAPPGDPYPRLHLNGRGVGHDSSAVLPTLDVAELRLCCDATIGSTNLLCVCHRVRLSKLSSQFVDNTVPGVYASPIYVDLINCGLIFTVDADGAGIHAGARSYSLRAFDTIFRAQVSAINGGLNFYELRGCYFRGGYNGLVLADSSSSFERGWSDCHFRASGTVVFTNGAPTARKVDRSTWTSLLGVAGFTPGLVAFQLSEDPSGTVRPAIANVGSPGSAWYKSNTAHRDGLGFEFLRNASPVPEYSARNVWVVSKLHGGAQDLAFYTGDCPARCIVLSCSVNIPAGPPPAGPGQLFDALLGAGNPLSVQQAGWIGGVAFALGGMPALVPEGGSVFFNTANPAQWAAFTISVVFAPLP